MLVATFLLLFVQMMNGTTYTDDGLRQFSRGEAIKRAWEYFFEPVGFGKLPEKIRCSVTAEFFLPRETIQRHPRDFYLRAIQWVLDSEQEGFSSYDIAVAFEWLWHYIFGEKYFMDGLTMEECELYTYTDEELVTARNLKVDVSKI